MPLTAALPQQNSGLAGWLASCSARLLWLLCELALGTAIYTLAGERAYNARLWQKPPQPELFLARGLGAPAIFSAVCLSCVVQ